LFYICDRKPTFWAKANFTENSFEIYAMILKLQFFAHFDKATLKAVCCEVSRQKLFPKRYG